MESIFEKNGLKISIYWKEVGGDLLLVADVTLEGAVRQYNIQDAELSYLFKRADEIGFSHAEGDVQKNKPFDYYAEAYYEIIA